MMTRKMRIVILALLFLLPLACTRVIYIRDDLRGNDRTTLAVLRFSVAPATYDPSPPYTRTFFELTRIDGVTMPSNLRTAYDRTKVYLEPGSHEFKFTSTRMESFKTSKSYDAGETIAGGLTATEAGSLEVEGVRPVSTPDSLTYIMEGGREYQWHEILVELGFIKLRPERQP